jgi:hypothetical protein
VKVKLGTAQVIDLGEFVNAVDVPANFTVSEWAKPSIKVAGVAILKA